MRRTLQAQHCVTLRVLLPYGRPSSNLLPSLSLSLSFLPFSPPISLPSLSLSISAPQPLPSPLPLFSLSLVSASITLAQGFVLAEAATVCPNLFQKRLHVLCYSAVWAKRGGSLLVGGRGNEWSVGEGKKRKRVHRFFFLASLRLMCVCARFHTYSVSAIWPTYSALSLELQRCDWLTARPSVRGWQMAVDWFQVW